MASPKHSRVAACASQPRTVYIYTYIYICIHIYTHIKLCVYIYIYMLYIFVMSYNMCIDMSGQKKVHMYVNIMGIYIYMLPPPLKTYLLLANQSLRTRFD